MIIDIRKFIQQRESTWRELEKELDAHEEKYGKGWEVHRLENLYSLYHTTCSDLAQAQSSASDPELIEHLEALVSRAYGHIYRRRARFRWTSLVDWSYQGFPQAFRTHLRYFWASLLLTLSGALLGGFLVIQEPATKQTLFGNTFSHLLGDPSDRVAQEESSDGEQNAHQASFSSQLMTHNIRVSLFALSLGLLWGLGTVILLFYNGAILGAVCIDYILAGESEFLAGWLLPHGIIEIPAIIIAGQAGLMLAQAMLGWNDPHELGERLRRIRNDIACLIGGIALMLVWAGLVESYLSQTHEPAIAYTTKIAFGLIEGICFATFLILAGKKSIFKRSKKELNT